VSVKSGPPHFEEMNRCIERKGWKQVRSPQEQEQLSDAIISEMAETGPPVPLSDPKATEALARAVEDRFGASLKFGALIGKVEV